MKKFKLTSDGKYGENWKIEIDGHDFSGYVNTVGIKLVAGEAPQITLKLAPMEVEIPEEFLAMLTVDEREHTNDAA